MNPNVPARLFIYNDPSPGEKFDRVLWPNGYDKDQFKHQGAPEPLVHTSQLYFINDLDVNPETQKQMADYVHVCQQYNFNVMKHDVKKSQEDWFHALFFNYELCEIDVDLDNMIQFVLLKYEPIKEIPNSTMRWEFIRKVFKMVLKHKSTHLKIFLIFVIMTWEKEIANLVQTLFATPRLKTRFSARLPHIRTIVDSFLVSPYTRNRINYLMEYFNVQVLKLCRMGITPGIETKLEMYRKEQEEENRQKASQNYINFEDMNL